VLADRSVAGRRVSFVREAAGAPTLVAVADAGHVDWIAAAGISDGGPIETDARLAVCRVGPDGDIERHMAQGTHIRIDTAALRRLASIEPVGAR
jgi:hypothetical protein